MYTKIKIQTSFSGYEKKKFKTGEAFKLFEFNHPLNPFRVVANKERLHLKHLAATDINDGVISVFEKHLLTIKEVLTSTEIDTEELAVLKNELSRSLADFSTLPCTSNIKSSIFEHLNYILELLNTWQNYAAFFKNFIKDQEAYIEQTMRELKIDREEILTKIQTLNQKFDRLTKEVLEEILIITGALKAEHKKGRPSKFNRF